MGEDPGQVGAQQLDDDSQKSAQQLRVEIEETRGELGDTVEALAAKTDVKTRARDRADELKRTAEQKKQRLRAKVGRSSTTDDDAAVTATGETNGRSAVEQMKGAVRENPVPTAALAAFIGGVAFGRMISRP
jgi:ElaB/YqjD/DUF883 family membrane-anchored ribosome-binding protein